MGSHLPNLSQNGLNTLDLVEMSSELITSIAQGVNTGAEEIVGRCV